MSVLVFANGDLDSSDWLQPYFEDATAIIAADGGARHLVALSRLPDVLIGDLDSVPSPRRTMLHEQSTLILPHGTDKDETDLELALLYAVDNYNEEEILVFGGFGGRLDQMLANILLLMHPRLRGREIRLVTQYQRIWLVAGRSDIRGEKGDTVSLIPLGGDVHVARTEGLRWSLQDEVLAFGPARGVSNEMSGETAFVLVREGHLLCIHTRRVWQR
jgi:thiamine pyrophosphokinase